MIVYDCINKSTLYSNCNKVAEIYLVTNEQEVVQVIQQGITKSQIKVMNHIIGAYDRLSTVQFSYQTIANDVGVSYSTVKRSIHKMTNIGFCSREVRDWNSCIIKVNDIIYKMADQLQDIFFHLKKVAKNISMVVSNRNELPLRDIFISKPSRYILQLLDTIKFSYLLGMRGLETNQKEKRTILNEAGALIISPTLKEITQKVHLTKLGQLKLLAFTDEVLKTTWKEFNQSHSVNRPFDWIIVGCQRNCSILKVTPDWGIYYSLLKRYGVKDDRLYTMKKVPTIEKKEPKKVYPTNIAPNPIFAKYYEQAMSNKNL